MILMNLYTNLREINLKSKSCVTFYYYFFK
jgi:hypothetical protein